jgi:glycerate dehydrogenase
LNQNGQSEQYFMKNKNKIVVLDGYTLNPGDLSWQKMEQLGALKVYDRTEKTTEAILRAVGDASVVITNKTPITAEVMVQLPQLRYIGVLATGYNVVDVEVARERGIVVTNIPDYGTASVAQFTFALLLELCHHTGAHHDAVKNGQWTNSADFCFWKFPLTELAGKTLGIIGFGRIGRAVANIAQAFGMKVLALDRNRDEALKNDFFSYATLDELLANSDFISLHCPLTRETEGIINRETIEKMKKGVRFINTARGGLVNEEDLSQALNSGKVAGAAVDVVSSEPIEASNPLLKAQNCLITPHIAWAPKEARERLMDIAAGNLSAFLVGKPVNLV